MSVLKTQTVKKSYTITVTDHEGYELDRRTVQAESLREAIVKAYGFLSAPQKSDISNQ